MQFCDKFCKLRDWKTQLNSNGVWYFKKIDLTNLLGDCSLIRATGKLVFLVGGGMVKLSKAVENRGVHLSMTSKRRYNFYFCASIPAGDL